MPIITDDGFKIDFDYYPALNPGSPAAILLPDTRCDRSSFGTFPGRLNEIGFNVLAMDFRYKDIIAKSENMAQQIHAIKEQDLDSLVDYDVKGAIEFLSGQINTDAKRICVVGTSLGSRVALSSAVRYGLEAMVLISLSGQEVFPGGVAVRTLLSEFGDKPALFITTENDWGNYNMAPADNRMYMNWVKGRGELKIWPGSEHGMEILERSEASQFILSWLKKNV